MAIEQAIYSRLSNYSALTAIVSEIYANQAAQNTAAPYIVYYKSSAIRPNAMGSDPGLVVASYRFDIYSSSFSEIISITAQLQACLQRYRGTVESIVIDDIFLTGEFDLPHEIDSGFRHRVLEFDIHYTE